MPCQRSLTESASRLCTHFMLTIDVAKLRALVRSTLPDQSMSPWFPSLAEPLAQVTWHQMGRDIGLTPATYGTTRLLLRNPRGERWVVFRCGTASNAGGSPGVGDIPVEMLPSDIAQQVAGRDVRFMDAHRVEETVAHQLEEAITFLNLVPTVWPTVTSLVRSLHIIAPVEDEIDISFSDPALPFSIFVSVPRMWSQVAALRVAEAILHEAMHLQLTLVERVVPLVVPRRFMYFSPWRDEQRDSEGLLQALYVFGVIRSFLRLIPVRWPSPAYDHVANRLAQINCQIEQARDFQQCDELTPDGTALVTRLLQIAD